jgi:1-phosphofructokinase family hexose kinase
MILCLTPNPCIDRTVIVPGFRPGAVLRAGAAHIAAGGKGVNVARAVRALGGAARCAGPLGGPTGRRVAELAAAEGLDSVWTPIRGETRTSIIIVDPAGGEATVINEPGPQLAPDEWARLAEDVRRAAGDAALVCISGSVPPGPAPDDYGALLTALAAAGRVVWADTSGAPLAAALRAAPAGLKVNQEEAGELLGASIPDARAALAAATELRRRGPQAVVITLGADGAVLAGPDGAWAARPPAIRAVSAVGSGDVFLGALAWALEQGRPTPEALRLAVAAGAANALMPGGARFDLGDVARLAAETAVQQM